jgi:hypothetical protein
MDELTYAGYTGVNFGWPEWEGTLQDPVSGSANCSTEPFVAPIYVYPNPPGPGVAAVSGGPLYRTDPHAPFSFPWAYEGDLFFCEFYAGWMRRLERSGGGGWALAPQVAGQPNANDWATDLGNVGDLQQGPDGALYLVVMITTGSISRGLYRVVNTLPSDFGGDLAGIHSVRVTPNPARGRSGVAIRYQLATAEPVTLRVFDLSGRLVRTLERPAALGGALRWDGQTLRGTSAASGLYVFEIETAGGRRAHGKVTLAR